MTTRHPGGRTCRLTPMTILMLLATLPYALMMAAVDSFRGKVVPVALPSEPPVAVQRADAMLQQADPSEGQKDFLLGWLTSLCPEQVIEALQAMETWRPKTEEEKIDA